MFKDTTRVLHRSWTVWQFWDMFQYTEHYALSHKKANFKNLYSLVDSMEPIPS
jgi:hypothetical protein